MHALQQQPAVAHPDHHSGTPYQKPWIKNAQAKLNIKSLECDLCAFNKHMFVVHLCMIKCALYGRVSTKPEKGIQNPEVQLRQLRTFAKTQTWTVSVEYIDHESGAKANRPEFKRMMDGAAKREFDVLLFWSVDRFSREGIIPVLTSLKRLSEYGVKYRSLQEPYIDTTNEWGDIIAAFAAKLAELERKRIRARVMAGLEKARADGKQLGRRRLVFDRTKVLVLRESGKSIREIARTLRLSHGMVQRTVAAQIATDGVSR